MAIFSSKKNTVKKTDNKSDVVKIKTVAVKAEVSSNFRGQLLSVILHPRVTEKASFQTEQNVYTFNVSSKATKKTVALAIEDMYKVTPIKVNMVPIKAKKVFVRGKVGMKSGGKKAYVFLKKGDKIEIV